MQKIKDGVMQGLYHSALPKKALVLMLDLLNLADEKGNVVLHYKDYLKMAKISNGQFYYSIKELKKQGFISERKSILNKSEKIIQIYNNKFVNKKDYKGYVDTNITWFTSREYEKITAGEIRAWLFMYFCISKSGYKIEYEKQNDNTTKEIKKRKQKLFRKEIFSAVARNIGATDRMSKKYCTSLNKKDYIYLKTNEKLVEKKNEVEKSFLEIVTLKSKWTETETVLATQKGERVVEKIKQTYLCDLHTIKNLCRRHKIEYNEENLSDTALLINQYKNSSKKNGLDIRNIITTAFSNIKEKILDSKVVNSIVSTLIRVESEKSLVFYHT